ncbi:MAG: flagellar hook-length control protein FliK [Bacillota bacterium]|nr:flagellar hook-length control protein FliK [Bacillota bacterium]MDK2925045.1 flagellar hook-length control protein FliK [Bacillota bacterium]
MVSGFEAVPSVSLVPGSPLCLPGSQPKAGPAAEGRFADLLAVLLGLNLAATPAPFLDGGSTAGGEGKAADRLPWIGGKGAGAELLLPLPGGQIAQATQGERNQPSPLGLLPGGEGAVAAVAAGPEGAAAESGPKNRQVIFTLTPKAGELRVPAVKEGQEPAEKFTLIAGNKEPKLTGAPERPEQTAGEGPLAAKAAVRPSETANDAVPDQGMPKPGKEEQEPPLRFERLSGSDEAYFAAKSSGQMQRPGGKDEAPGQEFPAVHLGAGSGGGTRQSEVPAVAVKEVPAVFRRLVQEAHLVEGHGRQEIMLQLEPEKLGRVHLTILHQGGTVSARFEVENALARDALQAGLVELRQDLAAHGLRVEELQVLVGQNGTGGGAGMGGQDAAWSFGRPSGGRAAVLQEVPQGQEAGAAMIRRANGLDLRV